MSGLFLVLTTMLASGVEFVEALTVVLATGLTRGWRSALLGTGAAVLVLTVAIAVLGVSLARYIHSMLCAGGGRAADDLRPPVAAESGAALRGPEGAPR